ncbi:MAG: S41 family peptidase [Chloroflexi bacterium]|nr:MAG: S41 family peptidase [Chloroflexota bacterium]
MYPQNKQRQTANVTPAQLGIIVALVFIIGFVLGNQITNIQAQTNVTLPPEFQPLQEAYNTIQDQYIEDVAIDVLVDGAITGMVEALDDQFSAYMPPEIYQDFNISMSGDMEGIGATITTDDETGEMYIVDVLPNTPAEAAGVQPGDVFVAVNGESVEDWDQTQLVTNVRGPAGTVVNITFRRGDDLIELSITRDRFEIPNVEYEVLEDDIGYISMYDFSERSRAQLDEALNILDVNNLNGLIFDLRGNPGGLLTSAIEIGSAFIEEGPILYERFSDGSEITFSADGSYAGIEVPIVVLVNQGSASASELIAGALQDTGVATIIGDVTFGKGSVQTVLGLSNGGGLRITVARWLTPNRNSIDGKGVVPDIRVPIPEDFDYQRDGDIQLQAAVEFLSQTEAAID